MTRIAVFGYGSLVDPASAGLTLGRPVERTWPARLDGWRRRFSQARDNRSCEKRFARADDGSVPVHILALNIEVTTDGSAPNGALIELTADELARLDRRELRYDRVEIEAAAVHAPGAPAFERIFTYTAKPAHHAPEPPHGAVILTSYAAAVEAAFARLGPGELDRYRATTLPYPAELVEGLLVEDRIPPGNPRDW
jgi:cation transport regulator ChaC